MAEKYDSWILGSRRLTSPLDTSPMELRGSRRTGFSLLGRALDMGWAAEGSGTGRRRSTC